MLAPMVLAKPEKAWRYAALCTLASVLGGCLGYAIGYFLQDVALWLMSLSGHAEGLDQFRCWYAEWGVWVILIKGATPIPYKLVTITAGFARFDLFTFIWASVLTRGFRFFAVATVLKFYGPKLLEEFEKRINLYATLLLVLLVGGFMAIRYFG